MDTIDIQYTILTIIRWTFTAFSVVAIVLILAVLREKTREAGVMNTLRGISVEWLLLILMALLIALV